MPDYTIIEHFLCDHFHLEENTFSPCNNVDLLEQVHIPITRKSQCTKVNKTGTKLLEICKLNNLLILNGRLGKDSTIGKFTFRNTSVIDYTISTPQILHQFKEFEIIELDGLYSDGHCLQSMSLQISHKSKQTAKIDQEGKHNCRLPKWKSIKEQEFVNNLNDTDY